MKDENFTNWPNDEILSREFESVGFYISNHPLKDYKVILRHYGVKSFKEFESGKESECLLSGTIMSIKEKKPKAILPLLHLSAR